MSMKPARRSLLLALALILCLLPAAAQAGMLDLSRDEARTVTARVQEGEGIFSAVWKRLAPQPGVPGGKLSGRKSRLSCAMYPTISR